MEWKVRCWEEGGGVGGGLEGGVDRGSWEVGGNWEVAVKLDVR